MRTSTKTSFKKWQALPPFSLTPALSRCEREHRSLILPRTEDGDSRTTAGKHEDTRLLFPPPQGEGQGEGEFSESHERKEFSNDHD